ncbi:IS66 family insertion sequence element accessory protein TnpB [Streptococcus canis]
MTIRLNDLGQVYLVCGKTDMRQGIDSLAYLVTSQHELDPFSGAVYLFCGGRRDRFKGMVKVSGYFINALKTGN